MTILNNLKSFSEKAEFPNEMNLSNDHFFNALRKKEFSRIDKEGHIYLDYTGGNIYPESLVKTHHRYLQNNIFGNPHSSNPTSHRSERFVNEAREKVLSFFNAVDYYCIFTANASAALKIVGECYPFSKAGHFLLTADNHNSVNGIREYCRSNGSDFTYIPMNEGNLSIDESALQKKLLSHPGKKNKLFAYPAQSNASGIQHSLSWINIAQEHSWDVLLDAAAFAPTSALDLSVVQPDFVSISFYKIFGYPTGIGCLLVKKSKFHILKKPWYAGGTVTISATGYSGHFLKPDHEKFEDGTINYLGIPAITNGLNFIASIGMENINKRIKELSQFFLQQLRQIIHDTGSPLIKLYGPKNTVKRGGNFLINFFDAQGTLYPFQYIEQLANANKISLRTGCFCNPGIDEINHRVSAHQLKYYFTSRRQGDYLDFVQFIGKMSGAVRVSIGIPTTIADIEGFMDFCRTLLNKKAPEISLHALNRAGVEPFNLNGSATRVANA